VGRTHAGAAYEEVSPVGGTPSWRR